MIILFVIGIVGNCFYTADILPIYAILGIVLVFLSRFKNQVLVVITALLLLGTPRLLMVGYDRLNQTELVQNGHTKNIRGASVRQTIYANGETIVHQFSQKQPD